MESTKMLLEVISEFSKVTRCQVSIQKSIVCLYTHNEQLEMEGLKNTIYNSTKNHRKNKYKSNKICAKPIY